MKACSDDKPLAPEATLEEVQRLNAELQGMLVRLEKDPSYSVASRIQAIKRQRAKLLAPFKPKLVTTG